MDWTPGGQSQDVEDRRGSSGGGFGIGGGGLGIGGVILLLIISAITGRNFFSGSPQPTFQAINRGDRFRSPLRARTAMYSS